MSRIVETTFDIRFSADGDACGESDGSLRRIRSDQRLLFPGGGRCHRRDYPFGASFDDVAPALAAAQQERTAVATH